MKIAAAQIQSFTQDTEANIGNHIRMIELAATHDITLIVFPEMSLTGYELELAESMAFNQEDERIAVFREMAVRYKMMIVVGAPIKIEDALYIGSFIFAPDGTKHLYTKQYLHTGEEVYFSSGLDFNPILEWSGERISFAICADITNPLHPKVASENGATLYVPSIFYSTPTGIVEAYEQLSNYAAKYEMPILMANFTGHSYGLESRGKSAYWDDTGKLIGHLDKEEEGLLVIIKGTDGSTSNKVTTEHGNN